MTLALSLLLALQFSFARLQYGVSDATSMYPDLLPEKNWYTDFDDGSGRPMDVFLTEYLRRLTNIDVHDPVQVAPTEPRLRRYPFLYTVEPEQMVLGVAEQRALRAWLARGGFWLLDDFHGCKERDHVIRTISEILGSEPDFELLDTSHPLFHTVFDLPEIVPVPVVDLGLAYGLDPAARIWEAEAPCNTASVFIAHVARKGTIVLAWNVDLGDGIEWSDYPGYPLKFSDYAIKFFVNIIIYALSH